MTLKPSTTLPSTKAFPGLPAFAALGQAITAAVSCWDHRIFLKDLDSGTEFSYADIGRRIATLADFFASRGLARGDSVATNLENGPELIGLILSCMACGLRLALIEPQVPAANLSRFVEMVRPRVLFGPEGIAVVEGVVVVPLPPLKPDSPYPKTAMVADTTADDEAVVIFSSGTTGAPKGIVHTHANIMAEVDSMSRGYGARELTNHQLVLTLAHVSGLYRSLLMPFFTGGTVHFRRAFDPQTFWTDIQGEKIEFVQLVPSHIAILNGATAAPCGPLALRLVGTASAYLPPKEQLAFEQRFRVPLLQGYGLTECTCGITLNSLDAAKRRPGVAGMPLDVNQIKIVDHAGIEVEPGETGELHVKGPNVATRFLGYEGPSFDRGWLKTGDMGRIDHDGNITLLGRRANIINRGAYKIYALEVEEALRALPGIHDAAAIGIPHPLLGEDLVAFVTPRSGPTSFHLLGELRNKLASYKIPTRITALDSLPKNTMGKVVRDELMQLHLTQADLQSVEVDVVQLPRLCQIVAELFALEPDEVSPEFTRDSEPLWDSLGHIQVITAVEQAFGVNLEVHGAFAVRSIDDLAKLIQYALDARPA